MSGTAVRSPVYQPPFVLLLANIDSNPAQTFGTLGFLPYSLEEKGKTGKRRKKEEKKRGQTAENRRAKRPAFDAKHENSKIGQTAEQGRI